MHSHTALGSIIPVDGGAAAVSQQAPEPQLKQPTASTLPTSKLPTATVARNDGGAKFVKLRDSPVSENAVFVGSDIPNGTQVCVLEPPDAFTKVEHTLGGGQTFVGYVKTTYLKFPKFPTPIQMRWMSLKRRYGCESASMEKLMDEVIGQDEVKTKILDIYESFKRNVELKETRASSLNAIFTGNPGTGASLYLESCALLCALCCAHYVPCWTARRLSFISFVSRACQAKPASRNCGRALFSSCKYDNYIDVIPHS